MLDFTQPEQMLRTFVKVRSSLTSEEVAFYWSGNVYSVIPGQKSHLLFRIEGYNIGRCIEIQGGYQHLTREVTFYEDAQSGDILEQWHNPFTQEDVSVLHVWNDPVNQTYLLESAYGPFKLPITTLGSDRMCISLDVMLAYPSPLPRSQYPRYSQSDLYQGAELFQFFFSRAEAENSALHSIPCEISWTRLGPWLPWMAMADRPGQLLYQCRGYKLSYAELPAKVRTYVEAHHSEYTSAPTEYTQPNETSWTYFKKMHQEK